MSICDTSQAFVGGYSGLENYLKEKYQFKAQKCGTVLKPGSCG
jgi:hypothetical protein